MSVRILVGDALEELRRLESDRFGCVVTSPPYWTQVDYGATGQIGLEPTIEEHLARLAEVLGELRRVLRKDGTCWINYGDGYNTCSGGPGPSSSRAWARKRGRVPALATGHGLRTRSVPRKSLMLLPQRIALLASEIGWIVRAEVIWHKPTPIERADLDRPVKGHEMVLLLTKHPKAYWSGSRVESVWKIAPDPSRAGHPAPFPLELARRCIRLGARPGSEVLDPFGGSGTVGLAADQLGHDATLIELNPQFAMRALRRLRDDAPLFSAPELVPAGGSS